MAGLVSNRNMQLLLKPCLLIVLSLIVLIFNRSGLVFSAVIFVASSIAVKDLFHFFTRIYKINFAFTLAVSILLGYALGSAIYLIGFKTIHATDYQYWSSKGLIFDQASLAMALAVSLLASALLYVAAIYERPLISYSMLGFLSNHKAERLVWLGVALCTISLYLGDISTVGIMSSEAGKISPVAAIAGLMVPPLVPYSLLLLTDPMRGVTKRLLLAIAFVSLIGVTILLGRRYLIYATVLSVVALHMRAYRATPRVNALRIGFILIFGIVLYFGFRFFMALRFATWELGKDADLVELIHLSLSTLNGDRASVVDSFLVENIQSRPFILSYLAGLMRITSDHIPTFGAVFLYSVQMPIPSMFTLEKVSAVFKESEEFTHPLYGIPIFDGPDSALVSGFNDFGIPGALIYPLFIALLYYWFYRGLRSVVRDEPIRLFVLFTMLFQLLYIEQSLGAFFVTLRNLVIVVVVVWLLLQIPVIRLPERIRHYHTKDYSCHL
ncbi:MAG TPA: hypothetical protein PKD55_21125 [Bellilinea sp.]|nr:hypothetical protein [Bellilinea sp.]